MIAWNSIAVQNYVLSSKYTISTYNEADDKGT